MILNEFQEKFFKENEMAVCLLARAEQDYIAGRLLILEKMLDQGFCIIEQSVEKYLKAWLYLDRREYPKNHKLKVLLKLIKQNYPDIPEKEWIKLFERLEERWNAKYDEIFRSLKLISTMDLDTIDKIIFTIRKKLPLPKEILDSLLISQLCNETEINPLWSHHSDFLFKDNKYFKRL